MENNIEFASKWKKKLYPQSIKEGKEAAFDIRRKLKKGRSLESAKSGNWLEIDSGKTESKKARESLENLIRNSKNKSSFTKKDTLVKPKNKIKSVADKKKELLDSINKGLDEAKEKIASKPPRPKPNVKYTPLPKQPSKVSQLLLKNKGKLALLAGAGTLGAVGYGLYRKARSDKGKKRRLYNR